MRTDILIDVESNDLKLTNSFKPTATFRLVSVAEGRVFGEILIEEGHQWESYSQASQVSVVIPYLPYDLPLSLCITKETKTAAGANGNTGAMEGFHPTYFPVVRKGGGAVAACALGAINRSNFILVLNKGKLFAFSGDDWEFQIGGANHQNKAFLLACSPGNCRRYPTLGVGLMNWIGAPTSLPGLAQRLIDCFEADGTPVISAQFEEATSTLFLNLDTNNVDTNEGI